jgi:hypothetical protein
VFECESKVGSEVQGGGAGNDRGTKYSDPKDGHVGAVIIVSKKFRGRVLGSAYLVVISVVCARLSRILFNRFLVGVVAADPKGIGLRSGIVALELAVLVFVFAVLLFLVAVVFIGNRLMAQSVAVKLAISVLVAAALVAMTCVRGSVVFVFVATAMRFALGESLVATMMPFICASCGFLATAMVFFICASNELVAANSPDA